MSTIAIDLTNRNIRQRDLVPSLKLKELNVYVVGTGSIGRQVSLQLAAIGVQNLHLIDFDTVGVENLSSQGFLEKDLGKLKVEAVAEICKNINSEISIETKNMKFNNSIFRGGIIFVCVDSIETRKSIFEGVCNKADLFIDIRMSSEYARIFTITDLSSKEHYQKSFFTQEEAFRGTCTNKTTLYMAYVASGIAVAQLAKFLRDIPLDKEICVNLLSNEFRAF
jgi:molybdopterin/thiamine biosynthesis adenylyltransferase